MEMTREEAPVWYSAEQADAWASGWNSGHAAAKDITGAEVVEVRIRNDGTVIWVSTHEGTVLRICRIGKIVLEDER